MAFPILTLVSLLAAALSALAGPGPAPSPRPAEEPVRVMVLGVYHLGNPGRDLHNVRADDALAPGRQAELDDLARRLARFAPTKVAVEGLGAGAGLEDPGYARFAPADLAKDPSETVQVGYRLARQLGHEAVYGIDERGAGYFPYDAVEAFARAHGQTAVLDALNAEAAAMVARIEAAQRGGTVARVLALLNDPREIERSHDRFYSPLLRVGDGAAQPGAELNARWYERNARIFAKLAQVARPGDRVVVVFGSGHAYWLRHLVEHTPGFKLEEPTPYLR